MRTSLRVFKTDGDLLPFSHSLIVNQLTPNIFANRRFDNPRLSLAFFNTSCNPAFLATSLSLMTIVTSMCMISCQYYIVPLALCKVLRYGQNCGFCHQFGAICEVTVNEGWFCGTKNQGTPSSQRLVTISAR